MKTPGVRAALALMAATSLPSHALVLTPQHGGIFGAGDGANSHWVQVSSDWRGTLYGAETWGTGIWGLADHALVMDLDASAPDVAGTLKTRVDQINFGDRLFSDTWGAAWAHPGLAPIFGGPGQPHAEQDNWAVNFWGYIAIPTAGAYNFGVLYDDGFRFTLLGAGGSGEILVDGLNSRDRLGFAEDLLLDAGLYGFQLAAYDRLEAGVVQLAWSTPWANDWAVVPTAQLHTAVPSTASPIPEPATPLMLLAGLAALGVARRGRR